MLIITMRDGSIVWGAPNYVTTDTVEIRREDQTPAVYQTFDRADIVKVQRAQQVQR